MATTLTTAGGRHLGTLWAYRGLVMNLAIRDLKLKYKGSVLGVLWSVLNPLLMMAIYTVVFSLFLRAVILPDYWALVLAGILTWVFFSTALTAASVSFTHNANLINKVAFPYESLPIATVIANFVNFLIMEVILLVVLVLAQSVLHRQVGLRPPAVLLPVILAAILACGLGLSLFLATLTVYFRDVEHLVGIGLSALFYVTPVLYPLDARALPHGAARFIPYLRLNPFSWFFESIHSVLYYGTWPDWPTFGLMLIASAAALVGGYAFFMWLRPRIPEEV
ncbi:MAG TPA: ABC transporter permease [Candidatus Acidoferrales bacterium]|nr:ABC transporter permease [Candidatus Acidoferrales bacterium]